MPRRIKNETCLKTWYGDSNKAWEAWAKRKTKSSGLKLKGLKYESLGDIDFAIRCYMSVVKLLKKDTSGFNAPIEILGFENKILRLQAKKLLQKYKRIDECSPQKPYCKNPSYSNVDHYHGHSDEKREIINKLYTMFEA